MSGPCPGLGGRGCGDGGGGGGGLLGGRSPTTDPHKHTPATMVYFLLAIADTSFRFYSRNIMEQKRGCPSFLPSSNYEE